MKVDALSAGERAYLLGLYFADGWIKRQRKTKSTTLSFGLQGDEGEIAERVAEMLKRMGLNSHVTHFRGNMYMIEVYANATNIVSFFAPKRGVRSFSGHVGLEWMSHVGGFEVPFIAGLLDGDGYLYAEYLGGGSKRVSARRGSIFGYLDVRWFFGQRKFSFLVDFVYRYVSALAPRGSSVWEEVGVSRVSILESGREALIRCGAAKWSWKVADWLRKVEKVKKEISDLKSRFLTTGRVARRLHLAHSTIDEWCRRGVIRHMHVRSSVSEVYRYIVPIEEVERLEAEFSSREELAQEGWGKGGWMGLTDVAKVLGVDESTLRRWRQRGRVKATLVRERGGKRWRYYAVPRDEVERLKKQQVDLSGRTKPSRRDK
jgi:hypothetical protein